MCVSSDFCVVGKQNRVRQYMHIKVHEGNLQYSATKASLLLHLGCVSVVGLSRVAILSEINLPLLTKKCACLLALMTAQRPQTSVNLDLDYMQDYGDSVVFTVPDLIKTSRPSKPFYKVRLSNYSLEKLCIVHTLEKLEKSAVISC